MPVSLLRRISNGAPTLVTACTSLPPEGALRQRPGKAGSAAPAGEDGASPLVTSCTLLPPEGALRQRPGKAGSAVPVGKDGAPPLVIVFSSRLPRWGAPARRPA